MTGGLSKVHHPKAPVAQLDRVPGYELGGRRFESFRARHLQAINQPVKAHCLTGFFMFSVKSCRGKACLALLHFNRQTGYPLIVQGAKIERIPHGLH